MLKLVKNSKNLFFSIGILTVIMAILLVTHKRKSHTYLIGIIQTISHPALEEAKKGFIDYLTEKLGDKIGFITKNAQGIPGQAHLIAQSFQNDNQCNGILAIGTMAAQAALQNNNHKPLFFAAVTNPYTIGLEKNARYACGALDILNTEKQIELMQIVTPHIKRIVLLYNISEASAQTTAKSLKEELIKNGYQVETINITKESEIPLVIDHALESGDALITPLDNTIATAASFIAHKAITAKKPFFVSDNLLVQQGALAAAGVNYYELGRKAAACTFSVLVEEKIPGDLGFFNTPEQEFVVNETTLKALGLPKPSSYDKIKFVQ